MLLCILLFSVGMTAYAAPAPLPGGSRIGGRAVARTDSGEPVCVLINTEKISFSIRFDSLPESDNGIIFVYELRPYEYSVPEGASPVAATILSLNPTVTISYTEKRLFSKFVFATRQNGSIVALCTPQYITNPEFLASDNSELKALPSKGMQGVLFANYTLDNVGNDPRQVKGCRVIEILNKGTNSTLNNPAMKNKETHSYGSGPYYYLLNASNEDGIALLSERIKSLAKTTPAQYFIVGNEVNVRSWNYAPYMEWDDYVKEYTQIFRVAYNAIKSVKANAVVMTCIDQQWDRNRPTTDAEYYMYIDSKDFLLKFNSDVTKEGNIDWGVAAHPHTVPIFYSKFWDMSGVANGAYYASLVNNGNMMTYQNISLLTNLLQTDSFKKPDGDVRFVACTETIISNSSGADVQGAALYASYVAIKRNPYIHTIIYLEDHGQNGGFTGKAQEVYNNMDGANAGNYDAWARSVIGISDWSQILR